MDVQQFNRGRAARLDEEFEFFNSSQWLAAEQAMSRDFTTSKVRT